jgi:hypothetical protein
MNASCLAAIFTVIIHLLVFGFLSYFSISDLSTYNSSDKDIQIQMEDISPEDILMSLPSNTQSKSVQDKTSDNQSNTENKSQGQPKSFPSQEQTAENFPVDENDTVIKKIQVVLKPVEVDSNKTTVADSVQIAEFIQKVLPKTSASNSKSEMSFYEKYQFYKKNFYTIRNFLKVYPYALKTKEIMDQLNAQLATMKNENEKNALIKATEKTLFKEYETAVRHMTITQGRLLLKLIARETNQTGYQIIKNYRGAFPANFWYTVGKIFGTDLKTEFHKEKEDSTIENILSKYKQNNLY